MVKTKGGNGNRRSVKRDKKFRVEMDSELLPFLMSIFPEKSRTTVKSFLVHRQVAINGRTQTVHNYKLKAGDELWWKVIGEERPDPNRKVRVLYEDEDLMIVDKKVGVLSASNDVNDETVYTMMSEHVYKRRKGSEVFLVNRLEQNVSGLMLLAKNEEMYEILREEWFKGFIKRSYVAVIEGILPEKKETLVHYYRTSIKNKQIYYSDTDNGGEQAILRYNVLKINNFYTLVQIELGSSLKGQLRTQLAYLGHPVAGDKRNGARSNPLSRLCLHANKMYFKHPVTLEPLRFDLGVPGNFK